MIQYMSIPTSKHPHIRDNIAASLACSYLPGEFLIGSRGTRNALLQSLKVGEGSRLAQLAAQRVLSVARCSLRAQNAAFTVEGASIGVEGLAVIIKTKQALVNWFIFPIWTMFDSVVVLLVPPPLATYRALARCRRVQVKVGALLAGIARTFGKARATDALELTGIALSIENRADLHVVDQVAELGLRHGDDELVRVARANSVHLQVLQRDLAVFGSDDGSLANRTAVVLDLFANSRTTQKKPFT